jgi:hypothetical protein
MRQAVTVSASGAKGIEDMLTYLRQDIALVRCRILLVL